MKTGIFPVALATSTLYKSAPIMICKTGDQFMVPPFDKTNLNFKQAHHLRSLPRKKNISKNNFKSWDGYSNDFEISSEIYFFQKVLPE